MKSLVSFLHTHLMLIVKVAASQSFVHCQKIKIKRQLKTSHEAALTPSSKCVYIKLDEFQSLLWMCRKSNVCFKSTPGNPLDHHNTSGLI